MQAIYQLDINPTDWRDVYRQYSEDPKGADLGYLKVLIKGVADNDAAVSKTLETALDRPLPQLDPVERAVLKTGAFELEHCPEVPYRVVINEAVDLARRFGATGGHRYINGVLDKLARSLRGAETDAAPGR